MKLLPNEEAVLSSNGDKIILTNYRIQMTDSEWGQSFNISIFLEDISSIEVKYSSHIILIIIGIICVLGGFFMGNAYTAHSAEYSQGGGIGSSAMFTGIIFGGMFFAAWWFTRKHIISISSDGGSSLNFLVTGMSDDTISDFIYKLSFAKNTRVNQLHKAS